MTDPKSGKKKKMALTSVKKKKNKGDGSDYINTCGSNTWLKFQSQRCKIERGITEKPFFSRITCLKYEIVFGRYLLMGGELGNETNVDLVLGSSAMSPPNFALIVNDDFITNLVLKIGVFEFSPISRRDRVEL